MHQLHALTPSGWTKLYHLARHLLLLLHFSHFHVHQFQLLYCCTHGHYLASFSVRRSISTRYSHSSCLVSGISSPLTSAGFDLDPRLFALKTFTPSAHFHIYRKSNLLVIVTTCDELFYSSDDRNNSLLSFCFTQSVASSCCLSCSILLDMIGFPLFLGCSTRLHDSSLSLESCWYGTYLCALF